MSDANLNTGVQSAALPRLLMGMAGLAFLVGSAALWWRFGEGVYLSSMMSAIIACF